MKSTRLDLIRSFFVSGCAEDLSIVINEDFDIGVTALDDDGAAEDISGWTFESQVRDAAGLLIVAIVGTVVSGPAGTFKMTIAAAVTGALTASDGLSWDMFRIDAAGDRRLIYYGDAQVNGTETNV